MSPPKLRFTKILLVALAVAAAGATAIIVARTTEKNRLADIGYSMMHFSRRCDFPQHSKATELSTANKSSETGKTLISLVTYADPLPDAAISERGYGLNTTSGSRERLNLILASANYRKGAISPIDPSEDLFQRTFTATDGTRTHTMILREENSIVLHFLEMEFDALSTPGPNKSLRPKVKVE